MKAESIRKCAKTAFMRIFELDESWKCADVP